MALTRTEVLQATGPTSGSYIKVKMGATKDGRITAVEADLMYEAGAYPGSPVGAGAGVILSPYKLDNLRIDGYDVVVNRPQSGAYRAPGGTNAAFASETVIDELAEILGIDPLEFRHINAAQAGDRRPDGPEYKRIGYKETVEAAHRSSPYRHPERRYESGPGRGLRFLVQWRRPFKRHRDCERRRHRELDGRLRRYRRHPRLCRDDAGRGQSASQLKTSTRRS